MKAYPTSSTRRPRPIGLHLKLEAPRQRLHPIGRRSLSAAFGLAALLWLCLGNTAPAAAKSAPANDDFANAATLSGLPVNATGTNVDATTEPGEPTHTDLGYGTPAGHSVWWSWTAPSDGVVTVDTCGSDFDTLLAVYTGNNLNALTPVGFNDGAVPITPDECETKYSGDSMLTFTAQGGQVYRIAVDGATGRPWPATGTIALALYKPPKPANDDFANATRLIEYGNQNESAVAIGRNVAASKETGEPNHAGDVGGHSVWFSWTAPRTGLVHFDTCGNSGLDTVLAVYTGWSVGGLWEVASNAKPQDTCSVVSLRPAAGQTYYIAIDGAGGSIGNFVLHKKPTPPNDEFENAALLSGVSAEDLGSNYEATSEPGEPNHAGNALGHSLWWRWTAPANGPVQVDTCRDFGYGVFDTVLAVYTGGAVNALSPVASNDNLGSCGPGSGVAFTARACRTYHIAVDSAAGSDAVGFIVGLRETATSGGGPCPATVKKRKCKKKKQKHSAESAKKMKCKKQDRG